MASNYDKMLSDGARLFVSKDRSREIRNLGIQCEGDFYTLTFMGEPCRIRRTDGECEIFSREDENYKPADFQMTMTLYDIIDHASQPFLPSGNDIFFVNLTKIQNGNAYTGKGIMTEMEEFFDGQTDENIRKAMTAVGGYSWGKGDVSCKIPVFGNIDVAVSFWHSDEDFPASLKVYTDDRILKCMHYETVWYMVAYVLGKIKEKLVMSTEE